MVNAIYNRRSIRKYKDQSVEGDKVTELLRMAMYAPTGRNTQLWEFVVVDDKNLLAKFQSVHPYATALTQAPVMLLVCANLDKNPIPYYYMGDCGAATQNILLGAHDMGLGTCWLGIAPSQERIDGVKAIFDLPEHIIPFCAIALGYPDEEREQPERFDPQKIHYNGWRTK